MQCPTTIVPFFGDQFFWGDRIHQKELGPAPIPIYELNVENLSNAIKFMLQPEVNLAFLPSSVIHPKSKDRKYVVIRCVWFYGDKLILNKLIM